MQVVRAIFAISVLIAIPLHVGSDPVQSDNLLVNPEFEERKENQRLAAWSFSQHAGKGAYKFDLDTAAAFKGSQSLRFEQYADQAWGIVRQDIALSEEESERFSFTAMLKTRDIAEGRGWRLTLTCLGKGGRVLKQYKSESLNGTNDWKRVVLEDAIPKGTTTLRAGIILQSVGTGWVDDAYLGVN